VIYTAIAPRWIAMLGYILAVALLLGSYYIAWSFMVLSIWVFLISISMLIDDFRRPSDLGKVERLCIRENECNSEPESRLRLW
jgi:hypothetical protein